MVISAVRSRTQWTLFSIVMKAFAFDVYVPTQEVPSSSSHRQMLSSSCDAAAVALKPRRKGV